MTVVRVTALPVKWIVLRIEFIDAEAMPRCDDRSTVGGSLIMSFSQFAMHHLRKVTAGLELSYSHTIED